MTSVCDCEDTDDCLAREVIDFYKPDSWLQLNLSRLVSTYLWRVPFMPALWILSCLPKHSKLSFLSL